MRTNVTTTVEVTLVLSQEEAQWLHEYMRNCFVSDEHIDDATMRQKFFEATHVKNQPNPFK